MNKLMAVLIITPMIVACSCSITSFPITECSSVQLDAVAKETASCFRGIDDHHMCSERAKLLHCDATNSDAQGRLVKD